MGSKYATLFFQSELYNFSAKNKKRKTIKYPTLKDTGFIVKLLLVLSLGGAVANDTLYAKWQ